MKTNSSPNVVPLCDILLVLLIIFMVITPMSQSGMDIRMPEPGGRNDGTAVVLTIGEEGVFHINKELYTDLDAVETRLRGIFETRDNRTVFVKSSDRLLYKQVVEVLDKVKGAGIDTICMMTHGSTSSVQLH